MRIRVGAIGYVLSPQDHTLQAEGALEATTGVDVSGAAEQRNSENHNAAIPIACNYNFDG